MVKLSIIGTVGVPGNYGGFETLAENLVKYNFVSEKAVDIIVYCSSNSYDVKVDEFLGAHLTYIPLEANGIQSVFYDCVSLLISAFRRTDVILLLGVSGAIILPFLKLISKARVITNIDGIEWRRGKWRTLAKWFLKFSEKLAVNFSDEIIADNEGVRQYVKLQYNKDCILIAYGGDHAPFSKYQIKGTNSSSDYFLALCRIEPENNIGLILESFAKLANKKLKFVGNWEKSNYGRITRMQYSRFTNIELLDPIYDEVELLKIRLGAKVYIHGHSAGGTNPSLVEMMHFGIPVIAFDCNFNRFTTDNKAKFFSNSEDLIHLVNELDFRDPSGMELKRLAQEEYTWERIGKKYFDLIRGF